MTLVDTNTLEHLGYAPSSATERVQMTTGSGVESVPEIALSRIEALGQGCNDFPVLCHKLPPSATVDGLLGLDFLRDKRLILDFRAGQITLY